MSKIKILGSHKTVPNTHKKSKKSIQVKHTQFITSIYATKPPLLLRENDTWLCEGWRVCVVFRRGRGKKQKSIYLDVYDTYKNNVFFKF